MSQVGRGSVEVISFTYCCSVPTPLRLVCLVVTEHLLTANTVNTHSALVLCAADFYFYVEAKYLSGLGGASTLKLSRLGAGAALLGTSYTVSDRGIWIL